MGELRIHTIYYGIISLISSLIQTSSSTAYCPEKWQAAGSRCYRSFRYTNDALEDRTWRTARMRCVSYGADLVSVNTCDEDRVVTNLAKSFGTPDKYYWLGLTDEMVEGQFRWVDGSEPEFTKWLKDEPNSFNPTDVFAQREDYVIASNAKNWSDVANDWTTYERLDIEPSGYICERDDLWNEEMAPEDKPGYGPKAPVSNRGHTGAGRRYNATYRYLVSASLFPWDIDSSYRNQHRHIDSSFDNIGPNPVPPTQYMNPTSYNDDESSIENKTSDSYENSLQDTGATDITTTPYFPDVLEATGAPRNAEYDDDEIMDIQSEADITSSPGPNSEESPIAMPPTDPDYDRSTAIASNSVEQPEDSRLMLEVGEEGNQRLLGEQGPRGDQGPVGEKGPQGDMGPIGEQGPPGDQGPVGNKGPVGDKAPVGDAGPQGPQGVRGPPGPRGLIGEVGPEGPEGSRGPPGRPGPAGPPGPPGPSPIMAAIPYLAEEGGGMESMSAYRPEIVERRKKNSFVNATVFCERHMAGVYSHPYDCWRFITCGQNFGGDYEMACNAGRRFVPWPPSCVVDKSCSHNGSTGMYQQYSYFEAQQGSPNMSTLLSNQVRQTLSFYGWAIAALVIALVVIAIISVRTFVNTLGAPSRNRNILIDNKPVGAVDWASITPVGRYPTCYNSQTFQNQKLAEQPV